LLGATSCHKKIMINPHFTNSPHAHLGKRETPCIYA
jgi:hypothetical protein